MPSTLEKITKDAMDLSQRQKLALAEFLIESADSSIEPGSEDAWDAELRERVRAIDEGRVTGVSFDDAMHAAQSRLGP